MISKKFSVHWWLVLALLVSQANCFVLAQTRKIKLDEIFTLRSGETAETSDAKLKIRLSVGRLIAESGEVEYVELQIRTHGKEQKIVISEKGKRTKNVGGYIISLVNAESFGEANCRLKVSRKKLNRRAARR